MDFLDTLRKLYVNFQPILMRYATRYLPWTTAEDVVHDSFLRYYEKYDETIKEEDALKILLCIVHNLCVDHLRSQSLSRDYKTKVYSNISLEELLTEQDDDIDTFDSYRIGKIKTLISQLTARQKELLQKHYFDNMSTAEIAIQTGLSKRTVENTIYRVLISLRKQI